jgi:hypothetical protein
MVTVPVSPSEVIEHATTTYQMPPNVYVLTPTICTYRGGVSVAVNVTPVTQNEWESGTVVAVAVVKKYIREDPPTSVRDILPDEIAGHVPIGPVGPVLPL